MSRQFINRALLYCLSILIFWNILIAIRAYRFTHFVNKPTQNTTNAGILDYAFNRFSGTKYYKLPLKLVPQSSFQTIYLKTSSNLKIEGWYIPSTSKLGTVIVFHGLGGNREIMLNEINAFHQMGYNVLAIDFRAHGNSNGSKCTLGVAEAEDVKLAYDYIVEKGEKKITLFGASMGAASIAAAIKKHAIHPTKVILEMPFENYALLIEKYFEKSKYPTQPTCTLFTFWSSILNNEWFFNMKPSEYVKAIKCPVLLQWGKNDALVPEKSTQKIYANILAHKNLVVYENSGHESYCKKEPVLWQKNVVNFLTIHN